MNAQLVKWREDGHQQKFPLSLEMSLQTHMIVLGNSLLHSVPEPYFFYKVITQGIIGERKGDSTAGDLVRGMQRAVHVVIGPHNHRYVHIVAGINLSRLVNEFVAGVEVSNQVALNFIEVAIGCPAVGVHYSDKDVVCINHQLCKLVFHVLDAPRDV